MHDIFACGRTAMNEKFQFTEYRSRISVKKSGRLIFLDNTELLPSETDLCSTGFFEGNTHSGTMFCYGFPKPDIADSGEMQPLQMQLKAGVQEFLLTAHSV